MAEWGAFAFGVVIGWFTYFTNRYRSGGVQFSDITTLVGVIGGGAVTALFGEAASTLFGAYGIGLAVGFFAYFAVLVAMVQKSEGVFTWTWFLDGRRKALRDDETTEGTRGSGTAMDMQFPAAAASLAATAAVDPVALREQCVGDVFTALRELTRRIGTIEDASVRGALVQLQRQLISKQNELLGLRLSAVRAQEPAEVDVAALRAFVAELAAAAGAMKGSADAGIAASAVLDRVDGVTASLRKFLA